VDGKTTLKNCLDTARGKPIPIHNGN
jgi:hypothetical protein